jgi:hypothetical protein
MPAYEALTNFINNLSQDNKNRLASRLASGVLIEFTQNFPEFAQFLQQNPHQFVVLSLGNNKCYRVENQANPGEFFVLKLEEWSMPQEIADLFKFNADLQRFLAQMYLNVDCRQDNENKKIQIQPFCMGGTIENAAKAAMTNEERIKNCINLYKDVTAFYRILENLNPPVLFPDGKPTNFTLDSNNKLQITDMKTFVKATESELKDCPQIDTPGYPLFLPRPPPAREFKKVHSRHVGINLYTYLTQVNLNPYFHNTPIANIDFSAAIFQTEKGEFFKKIIQATFSTDQSKRPDVEEIQNALSIIELLTQLDSLMQADPNSYLRAFAVSIKIEFKTKIENNLPLNSTLTQLKYRVDNNANLRKINDLLIALGTQNNANYNKYLNEFIITIRAELLGNPSEPILQDIAAKLAYRAANEDIIRQTYTRLEHIKIMYDARPHPKLKNYMEEGEAEFANLIQNKSPVQECATKIEYCAMNFETIRNIHEVLDRILQKNNSSDDFKAFVSNMHSQFENKATNKEDLLQFLNDLQTRDKTMDIMKDSLEKLYGLLQKHPNDELRELIHKTKQEFNSRIRDNLPLDELLTRVLEHHEMIKKNQETISKLRKVSAAFNNRFEKIITEEISPEALSNNLENFPEVKEQKGEWMKFYPPSIESQSTPKKENLRDEEANSTSNSQLNKGK